MAGFVVWFTGFSGSGKSTLAAMLSAELRERGVHVEVLDGDDVRTHLSKGLSFSKEDRDTNVRRIGFVAKLIARSGACAMTAAISPYRAIRDEQRAAIPAFCEVYCECPIPALTARDPKGLYQKALAGEIRGFTGLDDPYEAPEKPDVTVYTDRETKEESLSKILARLTDLGFIASPQQGGAPTTPLPSELVRPHGGELVHRYAPAAEEGALAERAKGLPRVILGSRSLLDLQSIASGAYSPLRGFMNQKDYLRVVREMRLENGLAWAHPITLPIAEGDAEEIRRAREIALHTPEGLLAGVLEVTDVFRRDAALEASADLNGATSDTGRPDALCVGGELLALDRSSTLPFALHRRSPAATRALLAERGWSEVAGFADPAPILRAHEYLAKIALEIADGLLLGVILNKTGGNLSEEARVRGAEAVLAGYFPPDRACLAVYGGLWRGGPRRLLSEAIVQKNYGARLIATRRSIDSKRVLEAFSQAELGVSILNFEAPFYSTKTHSMATEKTAPRDGVTRAALPVDEITTAIARGEIPDDKQVRPEVVDVIRASTAQK